MTIEARVMPDPWFRATASAMSLSEMMSDVHYRCAGEGERQLGPYVLPPFQRPSVWSRAQQVRLLESLWDGLPIGSYVFNQTDTQSVCDGWLLDGQQRITSILAYVNDEFSVYGHLYSELSMPERRGFKMRPIGVLTTRIDNEDQCREVYERLAYGGTPHEPQPMPPGPR